MHNRSNGKDDVKVTHNAKLSYKGLYMSDLGTYTIIKD
jgi:hypothetical protein